MPFAWDKKTLTSLLNMGDFNSQLFQREVLVTVIKISVITGISYCAINWLLKQIDPTNNKQKKTAKEKVRKHDDILLSCWWL